MLGIVTKNTYQLAQRLMLAKNAVPSTFFQQCFSVLSVYCTTAQSWPQC